MLPFLSMPSLVAAAARKTPSTEENSSRPYRQKSAIIDATGADKSWSRAA